MFGRRNFLMSLVLAPFAGLLTKAAGKELVVTAGIDVGNRHCCVTVTAWDSRQQAYICTVNFEGDLERGIDRPYYPAVFHKYDPKFVAFAELLDKYPTMAATTDQMRWLTLGKLVQNEKLHIEAIRLAK